MSLAVSDGMPCCSVISCRTVLLAAGHRGAAIQVLDGNVASDQSRGDDFPERIHLELVFGGEHELRLLGVEIDRRFGALEVIALRHFLTRLVEGVVHFLKIDIGGDVEGALRRHALTW